MKKSNLNEHEDKRVVPVVFALNNDYTYFGYVAIYSLIKNVKSDAIYRIYVFVTGVDKENQLLLESLSKERVEVKCLNISEYTQNVVLKESIHLSVETYYRLFIPAVLPQYERIIYLDSDICVLDDIAKILEIDISGKPVGAVRDVQCGTLEKHSKEIGNLDFRKTFNAGILVIDSKRFEEYHIREKCLSILYEDYKRDVRRFIFADQDALNVVLYEQIHFIDAEWNVQAQFAWRPYELKEEYKEEYFRLLEKARIMHFSGDRKPWLYPELPQSHIFWDMARDAQIDTKILGMIIKKAQEESDKLNCFRDFRFPYDAVRNDSKVIIYGAGIVGKAFVRQNRLTKYAKVVLWVDKRAEQIKEYDVVEVDQLFQVQYDYIIVAIDNEDLAIDICKELVEKGVEKEKIIWKNYKKDNNRII